MSDNNYRVFRLESGWVVRRSKGKRATRNRIKTLGEAFELAGGLASRHKTNLILYDEKGRVNTIYRYCKICQSVELEGH